MNDHRCHSCSMPIESGTYCAYCVTPSGELQPFAERFEKMVSWQLREHPDQDRATAERDTIRFMSSMPAWSSHPEVLARLTP